MAKEYTEINTMPLRVGEFYELIPIDRENFQHSVFLVDEKGIPRGPNGKVSKDKTGYRLIHNPSEYANLLKKHGEEELKGANFIKSKLEQLAEADSKFIKSVLVGTFYDGPAHIGERDESKPPYVKIGSKITPETVVYCVEAMLVFNEIKAGVYGAIEEKLVESGQPVNYNQPLFKIIPDNKNR